MTKQLLLAGAAATALFAAPAWAQDMTTAGTNAQASTGQDAPPAGDQTSIDQTAPGDIIVTAQKRSERLQDVPVAVTVLSGDQIAASGATNIEGAQYQVPSLNFRKSGTAINQSLFLRGVGTSTFSIAGEPSISTVVDGVVYSRAGEAFSDLVDIDRLEVLRGPQGTLFGKNTSAGVINIVSKRPGKDFGGYVEGGYFFGNGNEYRVRGALDLPFGEVAALRLTGFYGTYEGNVRNTVYDTRVNGFERYGVRGVFVADPTPNLTITIIGDWRKSDDDCCAELIGTTPANFTAGVLPPQRGNETRQARQNLVTSTLEESWGGSFQADWSLGTQTVTYIGSYREYDNTEIRDGDWLPQPYVGAVQLHDFGPQTSDTLTQELRLTSPADQFFAYVIGAFYSRAYTERTFTRNVIGCNLTPAPAASVAVPCTTPGVTPFTGTGTANFGSTFKNLAFFGQGTLNFTDRFRGIVGLRYTTDQLDVFLNRVTTGTGVAGSFGPFRGKTTNDNLSGRAGLQFDLAPSSTLYGTYSRGYKGPAFNVFFGLGATGTNVIEPETADSFEAGLKNTLFAGRLVLNLAAFYAKYSNFQANNPDTLVAGGSRRWSRASPMPVRSQREVSSST
ncbi:TonB-dependent receptor [Sphingomonas sp.]|jgi:iron complex outermembrane receptor protein|uniref:TonB-dependent receptor n=1 Tax=Sphingomonas sp. TaxID=28214 RepID=UPI002D7F736D|nr:TonB-dependent receptor [Sphingomonas sp.]HEU0043949.1 TonB-dependent receptor [Sphingomonas sp.]